MALGKVDIGLDINTKSATNALNSLRSKINSTFNQQGTKTFDQSLKQTENNIRNLEKKAEELRQKMQTLVTADTPPKSVTAMEQELERTIQKSDKAGIEFEKLKAQYQELSAEIGRKQRGGIYVSPTEQATLQNIQEKMLLAGEEVDRTSLKIEELQRKLEAVRANPQATDEYKKLETELSTVNGQLDEQKEKYRELGNEQSKLAQNQMQISDTVSDSTGSMVGMIESLKNPFDGVIKSVEKFGHRIFGLAKRVFIFSLITKALRKLRTGLGNILKSNSQFMASLGQIKGNLWTAFAPIWNAALPALNALMSTLATATRYVAAFISMLFGKTVKSSQTAAKSLYNTATAYSATGSAAKDAAKDAEKSTLAFDELNQIQSPNADSGATGGGGGGVVTPDFDSVTDIDTTPLDKFKEKLIPINESLGRLKEALEPFKTFVWQGLVDFYNRCLMPIGNWALGEGLPRFIDGIANILANVNWSNLNKGLANLWDAVSKFMVNTIGEGLLWFYENVIVPMTTWALNNLIPDALDLITAAIEFLNEIIEGAEPALLWFWKTFLVPIGNFTWKVVIDFINLLTNAFKALTDWAKNNQDTVENISVAVLGFLAGVWVYNTTKNIITFLKNLSKAFVTFAAGGWKAAVAANMGNIAFGLLAAAILVIAKNWNKMSSMQKVVSVLGALAIAAVAAAAAVGALQSAWSLGVAAAAIVAGIVAITASVKAAKKDATNEFKNLDMDTQVSGSIELPSDLTNLPYLAQGAVLKANNPFLAVVGDQKHGTNVEAPLSTIEQAVSNVVNTDLLNEMKKSNILQQAALDLSKYNTNLLEGKILPATTSFTQKVYSDNLRTQTDMDIIDEHIRQGFNAMVNAIVSSSRDTNINFTGNLSQLARVLTPAIEKERRRTGTKLVTGGAF